MVVISIIIFLFCLVGILLLPNIFHHKDNINNKNNSVEKKKDSKTNTIENDVNEDENMPDNADIIGKIKISGTNIDEYIVQGDDNDYYLNHNPNKEEDNAGSVFLDYRNNISDRKLLIFGHNARKLKTVPFHDLEKYKDESFYANNKYVNLRLGEENSKWLIFSVMIVKKGDNTHMKLNFSDSGWLQHLTWLKDNSLYDTKVDVSANDRIVIIQTCNYNPDDTLILISAKKYK